MMKQSRTLRIEAVNSEHLTQIVSLAKTYQLDQQSPPEKNLKMGFLVSGFEEQDYWELMARANYFYALLENQDVIGFLLAYSSDRIQDSEWLNLLIKYRNRVPFFVIKQICIRSERTREGLATSLYQYCLSQAKEQYGFAAIVLNPINYASIAFHEKLGFKKIFEEIPPDGIRRGVWQYDKGHKKKLETILEQYKIAIDLYKHEDLLNWNKLNNLFYVNAGLLAIIGFLLKEETTITINVICLILIVSLIGFSMSCIFWVALLSGVAYLHSRKDRASEIEKRLRAELRAETVMSFNSQKVLGRKYLRRSWTAITLQTIPVVFIGTWGYILITVVMELIK